MPDRPTSSDAMGRLNAALEGRYRIERQLGEGGMATVYLADDLRHERKVALKVLKPALAAIVGAERFLAEIKTTANLQHPHILPLFDSGEADGFLFYVMPYVEGESLRERLDRDQQLPVGEAVAIAAKVAGALQAAHEQGVIHRDVKPANILLSKGEPLVSDFGIALAVSAGGAGRLTETGMSLGTPHYMSPEQATGDQAVGPASDTYALGCVLYEMLVGEPPYVGSSAQAVLGKIIQGGTVSATAARRSVPRNVDAAIRRALERLPADRFATTGDFAEALADPGFRWGVESGADAAAGAGFWRPLALGLAAATVASTVGLAWALSRPEPPRPMQRFELTFAPSQRPTQFEPYSFDLSPDGSLVVYSGPSEDGPQRLWVRRWRDLQSTPVRGSVGAQLPSVSPDGREVAFVNAEGAVVAQAFEGGPARALTTGAYAKWASDGYVYVTRPDSAEIARVPGGGGAVEGLVRFDPDGAFIGAGTLGVLSGGDRVLVTVAREGGTDIRVIDVASGEETRLMEGVTWARYLSTGHLLYLIDGVLQAAPLDERTLRLGPAVPLHEGVLGFSVSRDGERLLYTTAPPGPSGDSTELVWVTREGDVEPVEAETFDRGVDNYGWSLSPDGTHIALRRYSAGNFDIWIKDLPTGPLRHLTFDDSEDWAPTWTPDGERIVYLSGTPGPTDGMTVWQLNADGTGEPRQIVDPGFGIAQLALDPTSDRIVLRASAPPAMLGRRDLLTFRGADSTVVPLVATAEYAEEDPAVSHDGRWLAYASNETGVRELFVRPFPDVGQAKVQVSTEGGRAPVWAHGRRELYYVDGSKRLVAATYATTPTFRITGRRALFTLPDGFLAGNGVNFYSVSPNDERFLMAPQHGASRAPDQGPRFILERNWVEELLEGVPAP